MATKVRPSAGGAWNAVVKDSTNTIRDTTTYGTTVVAQVLGSAVRALNEWQNAAGAGTAAVRAQKTAAAIGLQIQEV